MLEILEVLRFAHFLQLTQSTFCRLQLCSHDVVFRALCVQNGICLLLSFAGLCQERLLLLHCKVVGRQVLIAHHTALLYHRDIVVGPNRAFPASWLHLILTWRTATACFLPPIFQGCSSTQRRLSWRHMHGRRMVLVELLLARDFVCLLLRDLSL